MIMIGLGANLPSIAGTPVETCVAALDAFADHHIKILKRSSWYQSAPVPVSDQPWFINGVVVVETNRTPVELLAALMEIERVFGRERGEANAARSLDLDLIAFHQEVVTQTELRLPHPRLTERAFVLLPLQEVAPNWTHPETGATIDTMIAALGPIEDVMPLV